MIDCKEASQWLSRRQERPLTRRQTLALWLHLALCDACRRFARQLALLRQAALALRNAQQNDLRVVLSNDAHRRIAARLDSEAGGAPPGQHDPDTR